MHFLTIVTAVFTSLPLLCLAQGLLNPDRGLYTQTWRKFAESNDDPINNQVLRRLKSSGKTISNRHYYFQGYQRRMTLPQSWLDEIKADLRTFRRNGFRVSLLFAYSEETNTAKSIDAPVEVVRSHLNQLTPILTEFEPVISTVLYGFIGAWGEGYFTNFYKNNANKTALLKAVLDVLPATIPFSVRTPAYYDLIPKNAGYNLANIGLYDHCILADPGDMGTFPGIQSASISKVQQAMTRFPNIGTSGETCPNEEYPSLLECDYALRHFAALKMMQLNDGWYGETIKKWKNDGCWAEIQAKLGYVPQLIQASATSVVLTNAGWSKPPLKNSAYAVLFPASMPTGSANVGAIKVPLNWDIRTLEPGRNVSFPMSLSDLSGGIITLSENYNVFVGIETGGVPDVAYRIVFANVVQWGSQRLNRLGVMLPKGTKLNRNAVTVTI